eukprot:CAMPEP_0176393014 /NCGR_PEP_ID=MMETSP0126-20121128/41356_1 /TAXON_ID=141414 ORGANISM="Strombidinopsis acuminatum, Strain SPMC142" /NCGR_SAMPLE_ID=MMETSP0126 /ASSEMBLY_ACC=CAM_ASM_000229 /LENGTH=116 /DNA_ID=CAMNT_0017764211 /DNA_START=515 /DNA_END=865 /DNA_ORIENTATION=-
MKVHTHFSFLDLVSVTSPGSDGSLNLSDITAPFTTLYETKTVKEASILIYSKSMKKAGQANTKHMNQAPLVGIFVSGLTSRQNLNSMPSLANECAILGKLITQVKQEAVIPRIEQM